MGDAVNVAARMEQTAEPGTVQITEDTYRLVADLFDVEPLGGVELKGKRARCRRTGCSGAWTRRGGFAPPGDSRPRWSDARRRWRRSAPRWREPATVAGRSCARRRAGHRQEPAGRGGERDLGGARAGRRPPVGLLAVRAVRHDAAVRAVPTTDPRARRHRRDRSRRDRAGEDRRADGARSRSRGGTSGASGSRGRSSGSSSRTSRGSRARRSSARRPSSSSARRSRRGAGDSSCSRTCTGATTRRSSWSGRRSTSSSTRRSCSSPRSGPIARRLVGLRRVGRRPSSRRSDHDRARAAARRSTATADRRAPARGVARRRAARILEKTEGNPLFVQEVARALIDRGVVERGGDGWRLAGDARRSRSPTRCRA